MCVVETLVDLQSELQLVRNCWSTAECLVCFHFPEHSCLWNHKSESYKNRQLRWKTLEHLRILLSAHPPPVRFTGKAVVGFIDFQSCILCRRKKKCNLTLFCFFFPVEDIKNKFKNLRTTFQRQYKMVKASKVCRSDDVFVPQWKHYQQLMFLQGCWDQDDGPDDAPLSPLTVPQEDSQPVLTSPGLIISFLPTPSTSSSSPCVSSNAIKCYWTEERERAVIAFYSGNQNTDSRFKIISCSYIGIGIQKQNLMTVWILTMTGFHSWWVLLWFVVHRA